MPVRFYRLVGGRIGVSKRVFRILRIVIRIDRSIRLSPCSLSIIYYFKSYVPLLSTRICAVLEEEV